MKPKLQNFFAIIITLTLICTNLSSVSANPKQPQITHDQVDLVINKGFDYIATQQNDDGGIAWTDENSNVAATLRVALAMAAAGYPQDHLISSSGLRPIDFLLDAGANWVYQQDAEQPGINVARAAQLLTAIAAANEDPQKVGPNSLDLIYEINKNYDPNTGIYGASESENVVDQVWAILGLTANNASVPKTAADWLAGVQLQNGSWNDGYGSFLDTTPLALLALLASGHRNLDSAEIQAGFEFMLTNQNSEGGWQTDWDITSNASITAAMLQVIVASDQIAENEPWQTENGNPLTALVSLQQNHGAIGGEYANAYSTAEAILGLSGQISFNLGFVRKINKAFEYMITEQESSGGWSGVGQTIDVLLALKLAGWDPDTIKYQNNSPLDYMKDKLPAYLETGPDSIGKAIIGVIAAGKTPTDFAGINLITALMETYDEGIGAFGDPENSWHQSFAILGLGAAGEPIPQSAVDTLIKLQQLDGGWEYSPGFGTWPDNTGLVLQALQAAGQKSTDPVIKKGFEYIRTQQTPDADWGDSSTTAYVLASINAFGLPLDSWKSHNGRSPLAALFAYQTIDGAFIFNHENPDDNLMATTAAMIAALEGDYILEQQDQRTTGFAGLVIDPGEGEVRTACVELQNESITGLELLEASGYPYSSQSGFMDSILDIANPDGETMYWSYWQWNGREWSFNNAGAGESIILPGTIEGWHFTSWEVFPSLPPTFLGNLNDICSKEILKNFLTQPYLNYEDVFSSHGKESQAFDPVIETPENAEPEQTPTTPQKITADSPANTEIPARSSVPIIIIATIGLVIIFLIVFVLLRKKR